MLFGIIDKVADKALELLVGALHKIGPRRAAVVRRGRAAVAVPAKRAENGAGADIGQTEEAPCRLVGAVVVVAAAAVVLLAVVEAKEAACRDVHGASAAATAAALFLVAALALPFAFPFLLSFAVAAAVVLGR